MAQLVAPYLLLDHELGEVKGLRCRADDYTPLEQCTSFEASIAPMHDGLGVGSFALHRSPERG